MTPNHFELVQFQQLPLSRTWVYKSVVGGGRLQQF